MITVAVESKTYTSLLEVTFINNVITLYKGSGNGEKKKKRCACMCMSVDLLHVCV